MDADYARYKLFSESLSDQFKILAAYWYLQAQNLQFAGFPVLARSADAAGTMCERAGKIYPKPAFGLTQTSINGQEIKVTENRVLEKPYCNLLHFERQTDRNDPKILLVAPMSGHFATLLRGTVEALLPYNDVYITDWANARDVAPEHGDFGMDDYVAYIEDFLNHLGPDTHVMAVCQPTVPVLAAVSLMAERDSPNQPLSMTLMGGPIDPRAAPTEVTKLALEHSRQWFADNALSVVPSGYAAQGQEVYPGYKQLMGFMGMNWNKHVQSHLDMFNHLCQGMRNRQRKRRNFTTNTWPSWIYRVNSIWTRSTIFSVTPCRKVK